MLACVILILGFTGMAVQTVLLRELLTVFSGNELVIGTIFGVWMVGEASGALAAGSICRRERPVVSVYIAATLVFVSLFPVSLMVARTGKVLIGIPPDIAAGTGSLFLLSAVVILPIAFVHGFQFITSVAVAQDMLSGSGDVVGRTYSLETAGSIAGGVATSLLFFPLLDSLQAAVVLALVNSTVCLCLLLVTGCRSVLRLGLMASVIGLAMFVFVTGATEMLQQATVMRQWGGRKPLFYGNSPYQNIVVMESEGQYTLFTDGKPLLSIPDPDIAYVEEFVHLPMLCHPEPQEILVLGGGVGGVIAELLKHPSVRRIDYVEQDPMILAAIRDLPTKGLSVELSDPRVTLVYADAREFVRRGRSHYDVVLVNFPLPETLHANRFFTTRFYADLNRLIVSGGVVSVPASGSLTYYSEELGILNASLLATLKASFPKVAFIPGEPNYYISGSAEVLKDLEPGLLADRLRARGIATRLVSAEHLAYRFAPETGEGIGDRLARLPASVNRDGDPKLLYQQLNYRAKMHGSKVSGILLLSKKLNLLLVAAVVTVMVMITVPLVRSNPGRGVSLAVAGTGFSAMLGELLLMYAFQVSYGSLFHSVGLLLALFMTGIAVGSWLAGISSVRSFRGDTVMLCLEGGLVVLFLAIAEYFALFDRGVILSGSLPAIVAGMFLVGVITGMTYPVASRLYAGFHGKGADMAAAPVQGAGVIYSADLAGGFLGGVAGAFLLLPGLGMVGSCIGVALIKTGTALLLICSRRR